MTSRGCAVGVLVLLLLALGVVAATRVPWHESPAPRVEQIAALRSLPAGQVERGEQFTAALRPATYGSLLAGLAIAVLLGFTPLGARLVGAIGRGRWVVQALLGGLAVVFGGWLVTLPFAGWEQIVLHRYGLSTQGWGGWTVDQLKGAAITAVLGGLLLLGFFGLARIAPRTWWAWGAAGAAALTVLLSFVLPVVFEPVFNHFTPMPAGPLRSSLIALADRDHVPVHDVLVADASRRTREVNAYVSGFGATRRIVVYDTLIQQATPAEVDSVVAHELGHAKDDDVLTGTILGALGAAAAVIAVYLIGAFPPLLRRAGVTAVGEPKAVALILALAAIGSLVAGPLENLVSRHIEARADTHALRLTNDPVTFEQMQARLAQLNLTDVDPNPVEYALFASHPSTVQRMAAGLAYQEGLS